MASSGQPAIERCTRQRDLELDRGRVRPARRSDAAPRRSSAGRHRRRRSGATRRGRRRLRRHRPSPGRGGAASPPARCHGRPRSRRSRERDGQPDDASSHPSRDRDAHQVQRARSAARGTYATPAARQARDVGPLLVQDRRAVVEGVECCASPNAYLASTENSSVRTTCSTISSSRAASSTSAHSSSPLGAVQSRRRAMSRRQRRTRRPRPGRRAPATSRRCCWRGRRRIAGTVRSRLRS